MQIRKRLEDGILILSLSGDFDAAGVVGYDAEIRSAVGAGWVRILLDLADVRSVDSAALGAMLISQKRAAQFGGGVAAANVPPVVARTLCLLGLDRMIALRNATEDAISHLQDLHPESVDVTGEEVTFLLPNAAGTFGTRERRGRVLEISGEGLAFSFENLDDFRPEVVFPAGDPIRLRFLLAVHRPAHVVEEVGVVRSTEDLGGNTFLVRVTLSETWGEALRRDMTGF